MPKKPNGAGGMQEYVPAGNGDASGEYGNSKGENKHFGSFKKGTGTKGGTSKVSTPEERKKYYDDKYAGTKEYTVTWTADGLKGDQKTGVVAKSKEEAQEKFNRMYSNMRNKRTLKSIEEDEDDLRFDNKNKNKASEELWTAVCSNDIDKVKEYFEKGGETNLRYNRFDRDNSLIMGALRNGNTEMVELLKQYGEEILPNEQWEYDYETKRQNKPQEKPSKAKTTSSNKVTYNGKDYDVDSTAYNGAVINAFGTSITDESKLGIGGSGNGYTVFEDGEEIWFKTFDEAYNHAKKNERKKASKLFDVEL